MAGQEGFEYSCDYCRIAFRRDLHIQCASCRDIRLCLTCFSYGKELPPHKNNHDYYVIEYIEKSVYENNNNNNNNNVTSWCGHEDILLLDGIEKYGLGNWKKIASHIGNNKTSKQTELHYLQIYCNKNNDDDDDDDDIDDLDLDLDDVLIDDEDDSDIVDNSISKYNINKNKHNKKNKGIVGSDSFNLNQHCNSMAYLAATNQISKSVNYYPFRHEFDAEYQDDAEIIISDLTSRDLLQPQTKDIALANLKHYDIILKMRKYVKNFILDRKLMMLQTKSFKNPKKSRKYKQNAHLNNLNSDQSRLLLKTQLIQKLQAFSKYFKTTQKYLDFIDGCVVIESSWDNIDTYLRHRKAGCRTLNDVNKRLNLISDNKHNHDQSSSRYNKNKRRRNGNHNSNNNRRSSRSRYSTRNRNKKHYNYNNKKSFRNKKRNLLQIDDSDDSDYCAIISNKNNNLFGDESTESSSSSSSESSNIKNNNKYNKNNKNKKEPATKKQKLDLNGLNKKFIEQMKNKGNEGGGDETLKINNEFDEFGNEFESSYLGGTVSSTNGLLNNITHEPSSGLLEPAEKDFCKYLKILPTQYMQYKQTLIIENTCCGYCDKHKLKQFWPNKDDNFINNICDFFQRVGWINLK